MLFKINKKLGALLTLRYSITRLQSTTMPMNSNSNHHHHHSGIIMILSPAKTLDLTPMTKDTAILQNLEITKPDCHIEKTQYIAQCMKRRTPAELAKLLSLSTNLAQTAAGYWKAYDDGESSWPTKPCIFAFSGAAYQGLDIHTCDKAALVYMQTCLRIIDPLYGILRPLDQIQPYRLEMAAKHVLLDDDYKEKNIKLADYWKSAVTLRLSNDLQQCSESSILLNLASDEYSVVVDSSSLPEHTQFIKVIFHEPNGKVVAVHAKRARGLMVRYLSSMQATTVEHIQQFDLEGYEYQSKASDETTLLFQRKSMPVTAASKRSTTTTNNSNKPAAKRTRTSKKNKIII